jgi:thiol-disulfide isomerase/thioredoxin
MKKDLLVDIISYFFILLFLYTGVTKLMEIHLFKEQLLSSPLLGSMAGIITWALPIGELLLVITLFIPAYRLRALYATLILMTFFTVYVTIILFMDNQLSCSCGGIIEELSPKQHVLFNGVCVVLSAIAIAICKRSKPSVQFNWMTGTSAICLLLVVGWILFTAFSAPATTKTGMEGRMIPTFNLLLPDSVTQFNSADIPSGKPFIVIGFSPWCIHCQGETLDIINHIEDFKGINIYYVTPYPFWQMKVFYKHYHLDKYHNIIMGKETKEVFFSYFKASGIPYTAVFDAKKRLKTVFISQADATKLAQTVKQ